MVLVGDLELFISDSGVIRYGWLEECVDSDVKELVSAEGVRGSRWGEAMLVGSR